MFSPQRGCRARKRRLQVCAKAENPKKSIVDYQGLRQLSKDFLLPKRLVSAAR